MIAVTILGNNSASPAHGRHPTSQLIQTTHHTFLVDCGEGTQLQMEKYKIKWSKINHIFISHLHGDHYFGLIGLIFTLGLNKRFADLHIYSPEGLQEVIELQFKVARASIPYTLHFHVLNEEGVIFKDQKMEVSTFKVKHGIPCFGFLFREIRNLRKLDIVKINQFNIPKEYFESLHQGKDFITPEGKTISNEQLTLPGKHAESYAYCADTAYYEEICKHIHGVDLIYHESTYLGEQSQRAMERFHSTTLQAATIAKKSGAKKLLLGHYSSMYDDVEIFQQEAQTIFKNSEATIEGTTYLIEETS